MTAQTLKKSLLNYAICGKLSAKWRKENQANSVISELDNSVILGLDPRISTENSQKDFNPPFEILNSWQWVKLGDICEIVTGSTPPKANKEYYGDEYPFYKPSDLDAGIQVENSADKISKNGFEISRRLPKNSILVTCIGATIGKTGLIHKEGICNQQINAILPNEKFLSKFLFFAITSEFFQNEIKQNASSTTLPILNKGKFSNLFIPLPPLDEQEFIVSELEKLMSLAHSYEVEFQKLQNSKKELKTLKKSLLNYTISGKLTTNWRNSRISKNPNSRILEFSTDHHANVKDTKHAGVIPRLDRGISTKDFEPPFEIPDSWDWVKLGDIGEIVTGSTPPKANKEYYGDDYPFYKPADLDAGIQVENSADKISKKGFEISRQLPKNSILVTCIGATIGKTGLIHKEGICNQQINAILPNEKFISKFLFFAITSEFFQNEIKQNASSTTLPILNKGRFSNLYIPLPPKDEQERIVKKLDELFDILELIENSL